MFSLAQHQGSSVLDAFKHLNAQEWDHVAKAILTSGGSSHLDFKDSFTGVPALKYESLDATMRAITATRKHFPLQKLLKSRKATSNILEQTTRTSIGGDIFSAFHGETSDIRQNNPEYDRGILRMKYLMDGYETSLVSQLINTVADVNVEQKEAAVLRIMTSLEYGIVHTNEGNVSEHIHGLEANILSKVPTHVIDLDASSNTDDLYKAIQTISQRASGADGGWGEVTNYLLSDSVDLDLQNHLNPQYRIPIDTQKVDYGSQVMGIRTGRGDVRPIHSRWLQDGDATNIVAPAIVRNPNLVSAGLPAAPAITPTANAGPVAGSKFTTGRNGTYYYAAACLNDKGEGLATISASVTVVVGGSVSLAIDPVDGTGQTAIAIYRSKQNPATAPGAADMRLVEIVPHTGNGVLTYVDKNENLPGQSKIFVGNFQDPRSIELRTLLPLGKFSLYPTLKAALPSAMLHFVTLQVGIPQHFWMIKNYVPKTNQWKPHT